MKRLLKSCLIVCSILLASIIINQSYWLLSDIQQQTYDKLQHEKLNLYEKSSIYSIHLSMCALGWILSPEAALQQCLCCIHHDGVWELHSRYFSDKFKVKKEGYISYSSYNFHNFRESLALNGTYYYDGKIYPKDCLFIYPNLQKVTYIGPFKFHEGLFRYLQDIGWMSIPKITWII